MIKAFNKGFGIDNVFNQTFRKFKNQFFDLEKEFGKDFRGWGPGSKTFQDGKNMGGNFRKKQGQVIRADEHNQEFSKMEKMGENFERQGFNVKRSGAGDQYQWVSGNKVYNNDRFYGKKYFAYARDNENPSRSSFEGYAKMWKSKDGSRKEFMSFEKFEFGETQHYIKNRNFQKQPANKVVPKQDSSKNIDNKDSTCYASIYD